jgi:DNA (cytosine-5)-methyltransferase 1
MQRWGQQFAADGEAQRQVRQWFDQPEPLRVANGVPHRVDRMRSLGNAVVPQIPEIIGRAIMKCAVMQS